MIEKLLIPRVHGVAESRKTREKDPVLQASACCYFSNGTNARITAWEGVEQRQEGRLLGYGCKARTKENDAAPCVSNRGSAGRCWRKISDHRLNPVIWRTAGAPASGAIPEPCLKPGSILTRALTLQYNIDESRYRNIPRKFPRPYAGSVQTMMHGGQGNDGN